MRTALTRAFRVLADCLAPSPLTAMARRGAAAAAKAVPPSYSKRDARIQNAVHAVFESLEERALMSTYYVSASGNDSNKGTSASSPWQSIAKVNSTHFNPGDTLLFQGGQTFYGQLTFYNDGGSANNRFTISSYGSGKATINSGSGRALYVLDGSGITIDNLNIVGTPGDTATQDGIRIENYSSNTVESGFTVENCTISGFALAGVDFGSDTSSEGLNDLLITGNDIYNNVMTGIESYSVNSQSNTNITISYNQVHDNYGDGHSVCTGSGIMLQGLNNATVEYNAAYHNGAVGGNGGVGIWCYSSNDVTFQYNESYDNCTTRGEDGDGFDFDCDVSNSVIQYNYAYNNDGTGAQLDQWYNDSDFTNDIVRYNVFQDNGRLNNYGNLEVWGKVYNAYLYNNVIYTTPGESGSNSAIRVHNSTIPGFYVNGVHFLNNIIDTTGGATLINIPEQEAQGAQNLTFTGNVYWTNGYTPTISDGNNTYHTLTEWQSAGQETYGGKTYGVFANPDFANATSSTPASSISGSSSLASAAAGYELTAGSPAFSQLINIDAMYGVSTGGKDFYGNTIASDATTAAGAYQSSVAVTSIATSSSSTSSSSSGSSSSSKSSSSSSGSSASSSTSSAKLPTTNISSLKGYDLGAVSSEGSNSYSNGSFSMTAAGDDIWGTSDEFRYDEMSLTGNGTIIAKIASLGDTNAWSKAGVMIRNSLTASSAEVSMLLCPDGDANLESRYTAGGSTSTDTKHNSGASWVKLVRSGNTFSGYTSSNGITWTLIGTTTVSMNSTVLVGLAVTAHASTGKESATFSNVNIT